MLHVGYFADHPGLEACLKCSRPRVRRERSMFRPDEGVQASSEARQKGTIGVPVPVT